jgi:ectoine hydroxylase-related dioxygenase (phytanoyl-CoA dioxygenase family)
MFGPPLTAALDDLLGEWTPPKNYGQVLITMPQGGTWSVPHKLWHSDFGYRAPYVGLFGVKYWAFFGNVKPGGGGTPQLAGSHKLTARYIDGHGDDALEYKRVRDGFLRSHPWLKALSSPDDDPERNARFMEAEADIDGLPARVVELTGHAGDIYLTHPWVMHSIAANTNDQPRLMRSGAIYRLGVLAHADDDGG